MGESRFPTFGTIALTALVSIGICIVSILVAQHTWHWTRADTALLKDCLRERAPHAADPDDLVMQGAAAATGNGCRPSPTPDLRFEFSRQLEEARKLDRTLGITPLPAPSFAHAFPTSP